ELERLSNLVGKPSENHPLHNSGLLSLDPVQDKTPLYSQLLQAYKWSNKRTRNKDFMERRESLKEQQKNALEMMRENRRKEDEPGGAWLQSSTNRKFGEKRERKALKQFVQKGHEDSVNNYKT
ncbi:PREDICTED: mediator of RNA polymerase II transcription subunit 27-B-like, partial [Chlamydotis macqueenii]|uniref:mediator of RNA polymerase II transcription subunit 27-B-like n=1 Tax=Chlamydotis macqueenii TaxID=187382 RepID=UPI0005296BA4